MITEEKKSDRFINSPVLGPLPRHDFRAKRPLLHLPTLPLAATAKALSDPKAKFSRRYRKQLMRSRERRCIISPDVGIPGPVKLAKKLAALPIVRLVKFQRRFARRASTAAHLAHKLPDGTFKDTVINMAKANLAQLNQTAREFVNRDAQVAKIQAARKDREDAQRLAFECAAAA